MRNGIGGNDRPAPRSAPLVDRAALAAALGLDEPLRATGLLLIGQDPSCHSDTIAVDFHASALQAVTMELEGNGIVVDCVVDRLVLPLPTSATNGITRPTLLAVARNGMTAPAEAEGLARRIGQRLELCPADGWAIGVAVSHRSDTARDLVAFAERALAEAWALGGDQVAVFDDVDREPTITASEAGP